MIDLQDNNGNGTTWTYSTFKVSGSNGNYCLKIGGGEGPPGGYDAMAFHNGMQFSTYNSDNDRSTGYNCALGRQGGWWHDTTCFATGAFLTGPHTDSTKWNRLLWYLGQGSDLGSYKYYHNVEMRIRPKSYAGVCEKL